jgi:hypothetical protein
MPHTPLQLTETLLVAAVLGGLACSGDSSLTIPPTMGRIEVTTATTGAEPDADGYTIQVGDQAALPIGASANMQTGDLEPGNYTVHLAGVAPNCTVAENPRTVSVAAGEMATVSFAVTCNATTGGLQVSASTSGPAPDADGYGVIVDGTERGTLAAVGTVSIVGLALGSHTVGLSGVAANCQVQGENPRAAMVSAGANAAVAFEVVCAEAPAAAGTLRITTATTGTDLDADGYTIAIDGGTAQVIGVNTSVSLTSVGAGEHSIQLGGVSGNCVVAEANPRSATVVAAGTAEVAFAITCSATSGTVLVSVTTSGSPADPNGYTVSLDGSAPGQLVGTNSSVTFDGVTAGNHSVSLSGLEANCGVPAGPTQNVSVTAGATVEVSFVVACSANTGMVQVSTSTTGSSLDDGYAVILDNQAPGQRIAATGSTTFPAVAAGDHTVKLDDVAGNCEVAGGPERTASVTAGSTAQVAFSITCGAAGVQWSRMNSGTSEFPLETVWAAASNRVFVAGGIERAGPEGSAVCDVVNTIREYDGSAWSKMDAPIFMSPDQISYPHHTDMWGSSADNVLLVGSVTEDICAAGGLSIFHWNGSTWSSETLLSGDVGGGNVWGRSADEVYIVGTRGNRPVVLKGDGSTWTEMTVMSGDEAEGVWLRSIWGTSPSNLYVVGGTPPDGTRGIILHYNGSGWSRVPTPESSEITDIWGSSADDIWAVGKAGLILHYDGSNWTKINAPVGERLSAIWGSSRTNVFAVGSKGTILHYDGSGWSKMESGTVEDLFDVWGVSAGSVFAVGANGTILLGTR